MPGGHTLTLADPHIRVLTSFIEFNKALTKFNEALTIHKLPSHIMV